MALAITLLERLNLGSHQGVSASADFTAAVAVGGELFAPSDVGLNSISELLYEPTYVAAGAHEYGVSYDRTAGKLTLTDAGAEASATVSVRILVVGK